MKGAARNILRALAAMGSLSRDHTARTRNHMPIEEWGQAREGGRRVKFANQ